MKYEEFESGQWYAPVRNAFYIQCCECGLTHRINFRLHNLGKKKRQIQFQIFRDERRTGQIRRWIRIKKKGK